MKGLNMDTLQGNEDVSTKMDGQFDGPNEVESQDLETQNDGAVSATAEGESPKQDQEEPIVFDERQQEKVNSIVGSKVAAQREAEREAAALKKQLDDLKAKMPQDQAPVVPELPDAFDVDYESKMQEWQKAVSEKARYDAIQSANAEAQRKANENAMQAQQAKLHETVKTYTERAVSSGIDEKTLFENGQIVAQAGLSDDLAGYILNDDKGPLITQYLAKNPLELDAISRMNPIQAGVFLEQNVKAKLNAMTKTKSSAPDPITTVSGNGLGKEESQHIKGGTFS